MKSQRYLGMVLAGLIMAGAGLVRAQDGAVVEMLSEEYDAKVLRSLAGGVDVTDQEKVAHHFLDMSKDKLRAAAEKMGQTPDRETSMARVRDGLYRFDMKSAREGDISMFYDEKTDMMEFVRWEVKKYAKMNVAKTQEQMKQGMQGMPNVANMPNIESALEGLPEKEKKQAMEALEKARKSGMYPIPGMTAPSPPQEINFSNDKLNVNGFECSKATVSQGDETILIWYTKSNPKLTKMYHEAAQRFDKTFSMGMDDDKKEPWELIPDAVPILTKTFTYSPYGDVSIKIEEIQSADIKTIKESELRLAKGDLQEVPIMQLMGGR